MLDPNQPVTPKQLREFGLVTGAMFVLLFALLFPALHWWREDSWRWVLWPWAILATLGLWALLHPASLVIVYRPWMKFASVLGFINTRIIMTLLFFLILFPVGLVMRLAGHDPMHKRLEKSASSYRVLRESRDPHHMERPF